MKLALNYELAIAIVKGGGGVCCARTLLAIVMTSDIKKTENSITLSEENSFKILRAMLLIKSERVSFS